MQRPRNLLALAALCLPLLTLAGATDARAGLYLRAIGAVQGMINGESTSQGHENWIESLSFSHGVTVPVGPTGAPTGAPVTTPLSLMTTFDRSTVKLFRAQATQEPFTTLKLEWTDPATGSTTIRFDLVNAFVLDAQESGSSGSDTPIVSLSFSYSQITITDLETNQVMTYNWNPASSAATQNLAKGLLLAPTPNPTQGPAEFRFSLPSDSNALLALYDLRGHLVRELHHGWTPAEGSVAVWDGTDDQGRRVAQGVYMARLTYPGREVTQRITVLR